MEDKLFVYGTLAPGRTNEHLLKSIGGSWTKATVRGKLLQDGLGATMGYPALILNNSGKEIEGFLFLSENLSNFWDTLDEFEGEGYKRVLTQVKPESGCMVEAYIYVLRGE